MRTAWVEVCRFPAVSGSSARDARDWFVQEFLETIKLAVWMEETLGTFTVFGRAYRIELAGAESEEWRVDELKVGGTRRM